MQRFPGEKHEFLSYDTVDTEQKKEEEEVHPPYLVEFLSAVTARSALPDYILKLEKRVHCDASLKY